MVGVFMDCSRYAGFNQWLGRKVDIGYGSFHGGATTWQRQIDLSANAPRCWKQLGVEQMAIIFPMLPKGAFTLAAGARGDYDEQIKKMGSNLIAGGFPNAILRIGHEFTMGNGQPNDWGYPWEAARDPANFVKYWQRIVTLLRGLPGARFTFDWNANDASGSLSFDQVYPGDQFVDVVGLDVYNKNLGGGTTPERRWSYLFDGNRNGIKHVADFAAAHGKPLSYPEWGSGEVGDDPYFMQKMADWIRAHDVVYHIYWDSDEGGYRGTISDGGQPRSAAVFRAAFGKQATTTALEAEEFSSKSGSLSITSLSSVGASGDAYVGHTHDGDTLSFERVNLSSVSTLDVRVATPLSGGKLEVRTGSAQGTLLGTIDLPNTSGWAAWGGQYWQVASLSIRPPDGSTALVLVFHGAAAGVADLDWIKLSPAP